MWFSAGSKHSSNFPSTPTTRLVSPDASLPSPLASRTKPPKRKRIVLCFDGTDETYSGLNTNVVDFFSLLNKGDATEQVCYYQPGIGTYESASIWSPVSLWCAKILDEAFAWYLSAHVTQGYQFLMQNYTTGDKVCIFGFSRGAYTARALAGMLHKVGLLPKDNMQQIPFAFCRYKDESNQGIREAAGFKQTFCRPVPVDFLGVWETVASVGLILSRNLPFSNSTDNIRVFRHALSLDEHRVKFIPTLWSPNNDETDVTAPPPQTSNKKVKPLTRWLKKEKYKERYKRDEVISDVGGAVFADDDNSDKTDTTPVSPADDATGARDDVNSSPDMLQTDVLEVWFSGCHSDVGGGAVPDSTSHALHLITLRWMVRQIIATSTDVLFDLAALERLNLQDIVMDSGVGTETETTVRTGASQLVPVSSIIAGSAERQLDAVDALTPIHDDLVTDKWWWILEYLPVKYAPKESRKTVIGLHRGRGRVVPGTTPNIHATVQERIKDASLHYTPKATWTGTPNWVE